MSAKSFQIRAPFFVVFIFFGAGADREGPYAF
jgi:hypothetical protein